MYQDAARNSEGTWVGGGSIELSQRIRGVDLTGGKGPVTAHHTPVSPHPAHVPSSESHKTPQPTTAKSPPPPPPMTAKEKARIAEQNALWKTEQVMLPVVLYAC